MLKIRLGLIARGDTGGVAAQTYDFYKFMRPHKTMLINLDDYTGQTTDESKYPDAYVVRNYPTTLEWDKWLTDIDVVFTVEAPYDHELYRIARDRGIKTICQYNYEWLQHLQEPDLPKPDLFLAPSPWHIDEVRKLGVPVEYIHVPVDRQRFPFKLHYEAKRFLHIAGHRTSNDRNGTILLLEALPYIYSDIRITIRTQDELPRPYTDSRVTIIKEDIPDNSELYAGQDVLILPRRYGGLSLQLNEALSCGMPAIMLDIDPNNAWLPNYWLVPAAVQERTMIKTMIDVYACTPQALAAKIDEFAESDITNASQRANILANARSWTRMQSQYERVIRQLCA